MANETVNALAVIDNDGLLAGIVTDQDIIRGLADRDGELVDCDVNELMTSSVITCAEDTRLTDALKLMGSHKIRHLVVVEGERPVAVVGVRRILSKINEHEEMEIKVLRDLAAASRVAAI